MEEEKVCSFCHTLKPLSQFAQRKRNKSGFAAHCLECERARCREWGRLNKKRIKQYCRRKRNLQPSEFFERERQRHRARYRKLREEFLSALGNTCYCCNLNDPRFLTIDHVENDGQEERKPNGKTVNSFTLLKRMYERFSQEPHRYRAACYNCNCARQYTPGKLCPHQCAA